MIYALLGIQPAFAQFKLVQIDAPKVRLSILPGETKAGTIQVTNNSSEEKQIKVYLQDWLYLPACDGTKEFKPAATTKLSAANWISFAPSDLTISAYGKQPLNYTVRVPADAKGGHYAVMFFEDSGGNSKAGGGVNVSLAVRLGALFYIEAQGAVDKSSKIEDFKVEKKEDKLFITAKFTNTGNLDITAKSTFVIMDEKGLPFARGEFNQLFTFPGYSASLTGIWKEPLPKGKYDLVLTINVGRAQEEAGLGRGEVVTKEAEIEIGDNGEVVSVGELK